MTSRRATTCCSSTEGKRANEQGQAEGAIGVILQEPDCGAVLARVAEKVGPVGSPHEAEYRALIRGLKLAAEKRLPYVAAFSDSANVVNQITGRWNKNERATALYEEVEEALEPFKTWQPPTNENVEHRRVITKLASRPKSLKEVTSASGRSDPSAMLECGLGGASP